MERLARAREERAARRAKMNKQELVIELQANEAEFQRAVSQGRDDSEVRNRRAQLRAELLKNLRAREEEDAKGMLAALADANEDLERISNEIDEQAKQEEKDGHHAEVLQIQLHRHTRVFSRSMMFRFQNVLEYLSNE
jgi:hypothetical protein